jgi:hypothetical protein
VNEFNGTCKVFGRDQNCLENLISVEGMYHLGGLVVGGRTIIKLILKKWDV